MNFKWNHLLQQARESYIKFCRKKGISSFQWRAIEVKSPGIYIKEVVYSVTAAIHFIRLTTTTTLITILVVRERVCSFQCSYGIVQPTLFLLFSCSIKRRCTASAVVDSNSSCFVILDGVFSLKRTIMSR